MKLDIQSCHTENVTLIHAEFSESLALIKEMYERCLLDLFYVEIGPPLTRCQVFKNGVAKIPKTLTIRIRASNGDSVSQMLQFLLENKVSFCWKNEDYGYEIDENFEITKSWELDDGMC